MPTRFAIDASLIIHIRSPMHLHLPLSRLRTPAIDPSIPESKQRHKGPSYPTFYSVSSDPVVITPEALLRGRPSRLDTPGTMSSRDERGKKISGRLWGSWQPGSFPSPRLSRATLYQKQAEKEGWPVAWGEQEGKRHYGDERRSEDRGTGVRKGSGLHGTPSGVARSLVHPA